MFRYSFHELGVTTMLNQNCFTIRLAGIAIEVHALFASTKDFCSEYLCEEKAAFSVTIFPEDLKYEREKSIADAVRIGRIVHHYADEYLETLALYRKIVDKLLEYQILLFHGSAIEVDGQCYLFTAPSGTGKSTHVRFWREHFGERAVMINDDKPLLSINADKILVHGTPWNGKHQLGSNRSAPLKAICLLQRGTANHIEAISPSEALSILLQQSYRSKNPEKLGCTLELVDALTKCCKFYRLHCNLDPSAAATAFMGMQ